MNEREQVELEPLSEDEQAEFFENMRAYRKVELRSAFDERQLRLIANCVGYARGDNGPPAGLPGHNLMMIVAKMAELLGMAE